MQRGSVKRNEEKYRAYHANMDINLEQQLWRLNSTELIPLESHA
jgi:hypothetical protein